MASVFAEYDCEASGPAGQPEAGRKERGGKIFWPLFVAFIAAGLIGFFLVGPLIKNAMTNSEADHRGATMGKFQTLPIQAPGTSGAQTRSSVAMAAEAMQTRRAVLQSAAAASAALAGPLAASADGANSKTTRDRARGIYGSRIFALQGKSASDIVDEKNAFKLYLSGVYRAPLSADAKAESKKLTALSDKILKTSASGGNAQADLKEFIAYTKISDQFSSDLTIWNPRQRRNAGAPTTDTIMQQQGPSGYSLYQPLPGDTPGFKAK
jgi:hypothetical protein